MDVCSSFTLSLTGGFQECRNCGREKKFHKLDFENNTIEYVPKTQNNNAAKFQQQKLQQIASQKQAEEDEFRAKACNKFELALRGQFQQCGNCGIEKKYHKLDTSGQIPYQPKQSLTKSVIQNTNKSVAVAEIVQDAIMVQSVKDRVAQMNKNVQKPSEPQFRPSIKKEEVKEKGHGQAEIVTDQLFTSVSDQKNVFNKQRNKKTMEEANHYIREQQQHQQETMDFRKAESQFIQSNEEQQDEQVEQQHEQQYEHHEQVEQQHEQVQQQYEQQEQQHEQVEQQHEQVEQQHEQVEQQYEQHEQQEETEPVQQLEKQEEQHEEQEGNNEEQQQIVQPEEEQNQDIY